VDKIGLFYGSDTGNTQFVAEKISERIGISGIDVFDVRDVEIRKITSYTLLILGIPTWFDGELQGDWGDQFSELEHIDLTGKTVALYGLGDQFGYDLYFLDALGILAEKVESRGASIIGEWPVAGYGHTKSKAQRGDVFRGCALDMDNEPDLTEPRIDKWLDMIIPEFEAATAKAAERKTANQMTTTTRIEG
tara:strand:+ start:858 stop:1433 length:576 start_codon:yes stop_codon:yes gene_type:complete